MHFEEEGESLDTTCSRRKKITLGSSLFPFASNMAFGRAGNTICKEEEEEEEEDFCTR